MSIRIVNYPMNPVPGETPKLLSQFSWDRIHYLLQKGLLSRYLIPLSGTNEPLGKKDNMYLLNIETYTGSDHLTHEKGLFYLKNLWDADVEINLNLDIDTRIYPQYMSLSTTYWAHNIDEEDGQKTMDQCISMLPSSFRKYLLTTYITQIGAKKLRNAPIQPYTTSSDGFKIFPPSEREARTYWDVVNKDERFRSIVTRDYYPNDEEGEEYNSVLLKELDWHSGGITEDWYEAYPFAPQRADFMMPKFFCYLG